MAQWYYGYGGEGGACLPAADATSGQAGGGVPGDGPANSSAWGYQSCTETLHPFSVPAGAWREYTFNETALATLCRAYYGVTPRLGWLAEVWSDPMSRPSGPHLRPDGAPEAPVSARACPRLLRAPVSLGESAVWSAPAG